MVGVLNLFRGASCSVRKFFVRLILAFVGFSSFFVITQDFQVFPTLISSSFGYVVTSVPDGVSQSFVRTADGESVDVWKVVADGESKATVVILRGNADTLPNVARFQRFLARSGITSYSFDYRGSGRSSGWPSEQGIYRDGEAVVDFALADAEIPSSKLSLLGISIGTGPASYLAARYHPGALVLVAPYYSLEALVAEMPLFGMLTPFLWYEFPNARHLQAVAGTRLTIVHGTSDGTIPFSHSERLMAALPPEIGAALLRVEGAGHNDVLGRAAGKIVEGVLVNGA